jgi:hypothetical protein
VASRRGIARVKSFDPTTLAPNDLRDRARHALATLAEEERKAAFGRLLAGLAGAGVNVSSSIIVLGIPARRADELTPSDMAKLLRYVRINWPEAIAALAEPLRQLFTSQTPKPLPLIQKIDKAA